MDLDNAFVTFVTRRRSLVNAFFLKTNFRRDGITIKCSRIASSEIGGLMGKDMRIKRRREMYGTSNPAVPPFLHWGGLALSAARQISAPHLRAPVQQGG